MAKAPKGKDNGYNPCFAYVNTFPSFMSGLDMEPDCDANLTNGNSVTSHKNVGRAKGLCCDFFNRVEKSFLWEQETTYQVFSTIVSTQRKCGGCPVHCQKEHSTPDETNPRIRPCKTSFGAERWRPLWTGCKLPNNTSESWSLGCTNPNSFGIITQRVLNDGNTANPGSPNGSCRQNCLQLDDNYYNGFAFGSNTSYLTSYNPSTFNALSVVDSELNTNPPNDPPLEGDAVAGPKLIWAGGGPNGYDNYWDDFRNDDADSPGDLKVSDVDGFEWRFLQPNNGSGWFGYLHRDWNRTNAWGYLGNSWERNEDPHLWRRKSKFNILDSSSTVLLGEADSNCQYVSYGCKDPNFASYDEQALLNCDGKPYNNNYELDPDGNRVCLDYFDLNSNGDPNDVAGTNLDYCYPENLDCSVCVDDILGGYYPEDSFDTTSPNELATVNGQETECSYKIWTACGGSGFLSDIARIQITSNVSSSSLYGRGVFWTKSGVGIERLNNPEGVGYVPPNSTITRTEELDSPLCQCNNQGCPQFGFDNYSPLVTLDCEGNELTNNPNPSISCCQTVEYGCTDPQFNGTANPNQNNYFCTADYNNDGEADNISLCMQTETGIPCDESDCTSINPNNLILGGVPIQSEYNGTPFTDNPNIIVIDDGSCEIEIITGCLDDGGILNGGTFPTPVYPGFSSVTFNPSANVHDQTQCEYIFGCPDQTNNGGLTFGTDPIDCGEQSIDDIAITFGITDAQIIRDNVIPRVSCCNFLIEGQTNGCTDPTAINYNPLAVSDDGSCQFELEGCTDPNAINYNFNAGGEDLIQVYGRPATIDDGSCLYATDFPAQGTNPTDGKEIQLCQEPLTKEEALMNVCQPVEIQSDVFIERGTQTVFESNQRLGEVYTIGGMEIYGYGFYNIKRDI